MVRIAASPKGPLRLDGIAAEPEMMRRDEILAEMRRTAAENGGKPLGKDRFERATGIGTSDWIRYWSRFGDIQRDAGLKPNQLQAAYEDEYLFEKVVGLIRELKKYPTMAEMRTKAYSDPDFPSHTAVARLGSKEQLISKLLYYCGDKSEYVDVAQILTPLAASSRIPTQYSPESDAARANYGFVYLLKGHPGEYKIGRTNLVDRRLSELGATAAVENKLIHEIKTDDPAGVEAYWHRRFKDRRMRGEWFQLTSGDVKTFQRWKRIY